MNIFEGLFGGSQENEKFTASTSETTAEQSVVTEAGIKPETTFEHLPDVAEFKKSGAAIVDSQYEGSKVPEGIKSLEELMNGLPSPEEMGEVK